MHRSEHGQGLKYWFNLRFTKSFGLPTACCPWFIQQLYQTVEKNLICLNISRFYVPNIFTLFDLRIYKIYIVKNERRSRQQILKNQKCQVNMLYTAKFQIYMYIHFKNCIFSKTFNCCILPGNSEPAIY